MTNIQTNKRSESGNVLFLILIAVALFAALSYVVTQSTRSGGGSTEREKNILSSAQMTQYPTALRTSIIRLVLGGVGIENVKFNAPGAFGASTNAEVFHPQGGGATYQAAPAELMNGGLAQGVWVYNADFEVPGIGLDGSGGNDLIAFLPNVSTGVCLQVNEELGLGVSACTAGDLTGGIPEMPNSTAGLANTMTGSYVFPTADQVDIDGPASCATVFDRQASGCFYDVTGVRNVFYSVLLER